MTLYPYQRYLKSGRIKKGATDEKVLFNNGYNHICIIQFFNIGFRIQ